jgi:hypothetical protein
MRTPTTRILDPKPHHHPTRGEKRRNRGEIAGRRMSELEALETRREVLAHAHARAVTAQRKILGAKYVSLVAAITANDEVHEIEKTLAEVEQALAAARNKG